MSSKVKNRSRARRSARLQTVTPSRLAATNVESSALNDDIEKSNSINGVVMRLSEVTPAQRHHLSSQIPPGAMALWRELQVGPVELHRIEHGITHVSVDDAFLLITRLWATQALVLASAQVHPALEIIAAAPGEPLNLGIGFIEGLWRISRFATLSFQPNNGNPGSLLIENPLTAVTTTVHTHHAARVAVLLTSLALPRGAEELFSKFGETGGGATKDLLFLLAVAGVIAQVDSHGLLPEDRNATLRQWEHHDLLFHHRSRQGHHSHDMGAGFRFKGQIDPTPALKTNPWRDRAVSLPKPNLGLLAARDMPFTAVLESRRSIRSHSATHPIDRTKIGEFLYRAARVRGQQHTDIGEFTSRPYPNGGASYEFEIYLSINYAADLVRGFYYYDPKDHSLCLVSAPNSEMEGLLNDAWVSAAKTCRPQVLITIASRFQRVSWKYSGMAYAAQLKNLGALYQTFYLVATAMGLAGCGLGLGNSSRFCKLTGTDYFAESSVGEFMLGTPA